MRCFNEIKGKYNNAKIYQKRAFIRADEPDGKKAETVDESKKRNILCLNPGTELTLLSPDGNSICHVQTESDEARLQVDRPLLWNGEDPVLYKLVIHAGSEVIVQEVGIRDCYMGQGRLDGKWQKHQAEGC